MKNNAVYRIIKNNKRGILIVLWTIVVMSFMSPDSPFHGPYMHVDSACFFMGGKALMNGLMPYVDFADSKGPLLWLIYGIGYLISPHSYLGVFIISVFFYSVTFYYNFRIADIFLHDKKRALAASFLMVFAYFGFYFHLEIRVEDFALAFVSIALYKLFKMYYTDDDNSIGGLLAIGAYFTALLLMKFTIAAMYGIIILLALWYQMRKRKLFSALLWITLGAVSCALPFVIYLVATDTFMPFVNEYFLATISTAPNMTACWSGSVMNWTIRIVFVQMLQMGDLFFVLILIGGISLGLTLEKNRWMPLVIGAFFYFLASYHFGGYYYYGICTIFILYLFIAILLVTKSPITRNYFLFFFGFTLVWGISMNRYGKLSNYVIWHEPIDKIHYEKISAIISEKKKPLVLYYKFLDFGFGLDGEPLPAGKYWMCQNGCSPRMEKEHKDLLYSSVADFIIMNKTAIGKDITKEKLEKMNYQQCYECSYFEGSIRVELILYKKI